VEEQQSQESKPPTAEEKERISLEKAKRMRQIQALELNRARIREQIERSANPRYNELLNRELEHLEAQLAKLR